MAFISNYRLPKMKRKDKVTDSPSKGAKKSKGRSKSAPLPETQANDDSADEADDMITQVTEYLFLSGHSAITRNAIRQRNISGIINVSLDIARPSWSTKMSYMKLRVQDHESANLIDYFQQTNEFIDRQRKKGARTLVHCVAGVSRSVTIVCAYLMSREGMVLKDAYTMLRQKRPGVLPNAGFFQQLVIYESQLFGCNSVRMEPRPGDLQGWTFDRPFYEGVNFPDIVWNEIRNECFEATDSASGSLRSARDQHHVLEVMTIKQRPPSTVLVASKGL